MHATKTVIGAFGSSLFFQNLEHPRIGYFGYKKTKKKKGLHSKTSWFLVQKYVVTKKKVFAYQSVGFWSQKKKKKK